MSRSSSVNDLIPLGPRNPSVAQKPRREDAGNGFDRALGEAGRSDQADRAQKKQATEARPQSEANRSYGSERVNERREEHTTRKEEMRDDRRNSHGADDVHTADKHADEARGNKDIKATRNSEARDTEPKKTVEADVATEAKTEAVADKPVTEAVVVAEAIPAAPQPSVAATPALSAEALLAALNAPASSDAAVEGAEVLATAAQTQSAQVVAQAAAPVVKEGLTASTGVPAQADKTAVAAQATAPLSTLEKAAASLGDSKKVAGGVESAEGNKAAAKPLETAETTSSTQSSASLAARDFAKVLDQVSSAQPNNPTTGVVSTSPAAAALAEAAKPATPADAMARADAPVPLQAVAVEIGMRAMRGSKEFSIRLDPEDLGRIDVRLEISEAGQVQAKVVVERVETLNLLQRDAKTLERAFDQAGLKTSADGLQFSLRDPGQQARDNSQQGQQGRSSSRSNSGAEQPAVDEIALRPAIYRMSRNSGLDIRI